MTRGRVEYFSLNKKYPLFRELKKIIFKTEGVEGSIEEIVGSLNWNIAWLCLWVLC